MKIYRPTPQSSGFYENHTPRNSSGTHVFFQVDEFYLTLERHETQLSLLFILPTSLEHTTGRGAGHGATKADTSRVAVWAAQGRGRARGETEPRACVLTSRLRIDININS